MLNDDFLKETGLIPLDWVDGVAPTKYYVKADGSVYRFVHGRFRPVHTSGFDRKPCEAYVYVKNMSDENVKLYVGDLIECYKLVREINSLDINKYLTDDVRNDLITQIEEEMVINLRDYTVGQIVLCYQAQFLCELRGVINTIIKKRLGSCFNKLPYNLIVKTLLDELTLDQYTQLKDSVFDYLDSVERNIVGKSVGEVYLDYLAFCQKFNLKGVSKILFSKRVQNITGLVSKTTSVNNRSIRLFMEKC